MPTATSRSVKAGIGRDTEFAAKPLLEAPEAQRGLVPVVLSEMCADERLDRGFAQRLGRHRRGAGLRRQHVISGLRHRPACRLERLHAQEVEGILRGDQPLFVPARQDVAREQCDVVQRERFAGNGLRRDVPRPAQVGFRIQHQIRADSGDPADRQMPERTAEIRATNVFRLIGPEISGDDVPWDGVTVQAEVRR